MVIVSTNIDLENKALVGVGQGSFQRYAGPDWNQGTLRSTSYEGSPPQAHAISGPKHTGSLDAAQIQSGAVGAGELAGDAVQTSKLADRAVRDKEVSPFVRETLMGATYLEAHSGIGPLVLGNRPVGNDHRNHYVTFPFHGTFTSMAVMLKEDTTVEGAIRLIKDGGGTNPESGLRMFFEGSNIYDFQQTEGEVPVRPGDRVAMFLGSLNRHTAALSYSLTLRT